MHARTPQSQYYEYWRDSPVSRLLVEVPVVGGSSAGLAVQGQVVYTAINSSVVSADALSMPLDANITLAGIFFGFKSDASLPGMAWVMAV